MPIPIPPTPAGENELVEFFSPDFTVMYTVPMDLIAQMPSAKLKVSRLVACTNYLSAVAAAAKAAQLCGGGSDSSSWCEEAACKLGRHCKFVHPKRPLSEFPSRTVHIHYIYKSLKDVTYGRQWVGDCADAPMVSLQNPPDCQAEVKRYDEQRARTTARILAAGGDPIQYGRNEDELVAFAGMVDLVASVAPAMRIPATRLLRTAGSIEFIRCRQTDKNPEFTLTPCSGYMCHNECRYGEECPHAHVIDLDPSQNAPFVRRTLRHVKAATEATIVKNEGRLVSGLTGLQGGRSQVRNITVQTKIACFKPILEFGSSDTVDGDGVRVSANGLSKGSGDQQVIRTVYSNHYTTTATASPPPLRHQPVVQPVVVLMSAPVGDIFDSPSSPSSSISSMIFSVSANEEGYSAVDEGGEDEISGDDGDRKMIADSLNSP